MPPITVKTDFAAELSAVPSIKDSTGSCGTFLDKFGQSSRWSRWAVSTVTETDELESCN